MIKLEKERAKKRKNKLKKRKTEKMKATAVKTRKTGRPLGIPENEEKDDGYDWSKGGTLRKALDTTLAFEESLQQAKSKLSGHIKNKASFVAAEGDLSKLNFVDHRRTSTMRRVSSMYQHDQEQAKLMAEARKKQRIIAGTNRPLPAAIGINTAMGKGLAKFADSIGNTPTTGMCLLFFVLFSFLFMYTCDE